MREKRLTWDDLADLYAERTGGRARIKPMQAIMDWALTQPDIIELPDGSLIKKPALKPVKFKRTYKGDWNGKL